MADFAEADLVLCRAGATTTAELIAAGKASIMVPFPFAADDHQRKNAEALQVSGRRANDFAAGVESRKVATEIERLVKSPEELSRMEEASQKARPWRCRRRRGRHDRRA